MRWRDWKTGIIRRKGGRGPGFAAIALCAALLAGCVSTFSPSQEASIAVTCQAYASALTAVAPYAGVMSSSEVEVVDAAVGTLGPICRGVAEGTIDTGVKTGAALAQYLAELLTVRNTWTP